MKDHAYQSHLTSSLKSSLTHLTSLYDYATNRNRATNRDHETSSANSTTLAFIELLIPHISSLIYVLSSLDVSTLSSIEAPSIETIGQKHVGIVQRAPSLTALSLYILSTTLLPLAFDLLTSDILTTLLRPSGDPPLISSFTDDNTIRGLSRIQYANQLRQRMLSRQAAATIATGTATVTATSTTTTTTTTTAPNVSTLQRSLNRVRACLAYIAPCVTPYLTTPSIYADNTWYTQPYATTSMASMSRRRALVLNVIRWLLRLHISLFYLGPHDSPSPSTPPSTPLVLKRNLSAIHSVTPPNTIA
jgi:hypothetical protein